jgi:Cu(I)/Ag(I) efflux system membrane fusion protein
MTRTLVGVLCLALAAACDRGAPVAPPQPAATTAAVYQCSMHPQIIRSEPGDCPICGMALQRVDEGGHAPDASAVPGHVAITLSPERRQQIGVTTGVVAVLPLFRDVRATATIGNDPDLYRTLLEYREALAGRRVIGGSSLRESRAGADALVDAAALRLRRMGIGPRELAAVAGLDPTTFILPGAHVWVYARFFEEDIRFVTLGMMLAVEVPALPGRTYTAKVIAIDPTVDPGTRTVRVRALVSTPEAELRPDAFAAVTLRVPLGDQLAIPRSAVIDTGRGRITFVDAGEGRLDPRPLRLGRSAGDHIEVLDGVVAGETVVTSANFLVDSESRLKAALAAFAAPAHSH